MEGGRRVRVEGRAAASERMVVAEAGEEKEEKDEEVVAAWGRGAKRNRWMKGWRDGAAREGETIMSGARKGERDKKGDRGW